jgi:hypothetical protein
MPKSPNDPAECSAEKEDMVTSIFDQVIGMGSKCVGCSGVWVWADKVSRPDYSSSHSFLKELIWNLNTNILLPDVVYTVPPILIVYLKVHACSE